jgi:hypothetical protein
MKIFSAQRALLASCMMFALIDSALADSVSGQFVLGDKPLKPTEVAAFRVRDQFNPRQFQTYVMLTSKSVDRETISQASDPYAVAINDDAVHDADYLAFFVSADGKISMNAHVSETQYMDSSGTIMGQKGSLIASCTTNTVERIACSVKVAKPVKSMDGPAWTLDINFDSAVHARPAGKPIAKDGGDAGKAFLALVAAAQGNDLSKIIALLTPGQAEDYQRDYNTPAENLESAKSTLGFQLPKKPKITGGEFINNDTAQLEVEGVPYEDGKMLYLVEMHRSNGKWAFDSSRVAGMLR